MENAITEAYLADLFARTGERHVPGHFGVPVFFFGAPYLAQVPPRTVEACLDWIVAGRPTLAAKLHVKHA